MTTQTDKILEKSSSTGSAQPAILLLANMSGINLNTTADQTITLKGGNTFIITDIIITNVSSNPINADQGLWYTGPERSGTQLLNTGGGVLIGSFPNRSCFINTSFLAGAPGQAINFNNPTAWSQATAPSTIYFSMGSAEGTPLTCDIYIYGTILN